MKQLWQLASGSPVTQDAGLGELSMKQVWEQVEEKIAALPPAFPPALIADWLGERIDNPISYTNNSMRVEHLYPAWDHIFDPSVPLLMVGAFPPRKFNGQTFSRFFGGDNRRPSRDSRANLAENAYRGVG